MLVLLFFFFEENFQDLYIELMYGGWSESSQKIVAISALFDQ